MHQIYVQSAEYNINNSLNETLTVHAFRVSFVPFQPVNTVPDLYAQPIIIKRFQNKDYHMGRINVILFDWDGTIAETLDVWLHTLKEAYAKVGVYI